MHRDPTIHQPGLLFYAIAIVFAAIAGFGWLQADDQRLSDELFLVGSWVYSLNNVIGFNLRKRLVVFTPWRKVPYVKGFLIPLSLLATFCYLIGNFVLSPMLVAH